MLASQVEQQQGDDEKKPLSISEALDVAKGSLEKLKLRVLGEVSEVNVKPGYANAYFTLKDETGTLPCQMWHDRFEKCGITLEVGMMVELVGRFSLYPKKGRMHFQVFAISVAGEGMLRQQVAMLQRKLEAEGLMAPERKVPVPAYPMKIGVVTSPRGDAIHDVLRTTRRRFPLAHIYVAGVPVEAGIGHEPDTTIADLVGDLRASTPTGAAEAATVQTSQLAAQLRSMGEYIAQRQQQRIQHAALSLDRYATRPIFKDPRSMFASDLITLDMAHDRLSRALPANIERDKTHLAAYASRLSIKPAIFDRASAKLENYSSRLLSSTASLDRDTLRLSAQCDRLREVSSKLLTPAQHEVALKAGRLHDLSPLATLSRGYAIARDGEGRIVKHASALSPGDTFEVTVADGSICATVDSIRASERSDS